MRHFVTDSDRLEAFSDGVMAVIITIMVLELHPPQAASLGALAHVWPTFAAYLLSFIFVGIYWNNHHHMLRAAKSIDGRVMWANLHLLFWISLVPFTTAWLGQHPQSVGPTVVYGAVLLFCALAYIVLQVSLLHVTGRDTAFAKAIKTDVKGLASLALYVAALGLAFFSTRASDAIFVIVALIWLVPDRRLEPVIRSS